MTRINRWWPRSWFRGQSTKRVYHPRHRLHVAQLEDRVTPATFTVLNTSDFGTGSFRDALNQANITVGVPDTINFDPAVFSKPQTITLTDPGFTIQDSLTINGPGADLLTIDGQYNSGRIFNISKDGATLDVTMKGFRITGGYESSGGAIAVNSEWLTLESMILSGNKALGFGGAVACGSASLLSIRNSTLEGNSALYGGAVSGFDAGGFLMENSSVLFNTAGDSAGGLYFQGSFALGMTFRNSTISSNTSQGNGGLDFQLASGGVLFENCTITANVSTNPQEFSNRGGGIGINSSGAATLTLSSTIVSGNSAADGRTDIAQGSNVTINADHCALGVAYGFTLAGNKDNLPIGSELHLLRLAYNGGTTRSHALGGYSAAINHGANPSSLATDQRGGTFNRSFGGTPDIGAFETQDANLALTPDRIWTGAGDGQSWNDAANWQPASLPVPGSVVLINAGVKVVVDGAQANAQCIFAYNRLEIDSFLAATSAVYSYGSLGIDGLGLNPGALLEVHGGLNFDSGVIDPSLGGRIELKETSTTILADTTPKTFNRDVFNYGNFTWLGGNIENNGIWTNMNRSRFHIIAPTESWNGSGTFKMQPGATLSREFDNNNTIFNNPFHLSGTLDLLTGGLALRSGGILNSATILGNSIHLDTGTFTVPDKAAITGSGRIDINTGININIPVNQTATINNLNLSGGTISGFGTLTITGASYWYSGEQRDGGKTVYGPDSVLTMDEAAPRGLYSRNVDVHGTVDWYNGNIKSGVIGFQTFGYWRLKSGATMNLTSDADWLFDPVYAHHAGHFIIEEGATVHRELNTGTTRFEGPLNNSGTIDVAAGTIELGFINTIWPPVISVWGNGAISQGAVKLSPGAIFSPSPDAVITGAGKIQIDGGLLRVETGNIATLTNLDLLSGSILGFGTLKVGGTHLWTAGEQGNDGRTIYLAGSTLNLEGTAPHKLGGRDIDCHGTVNWNAGDFYSGLIAGALSYGEWRMKDGSVMTITSDADWVFNSAVYYIKAQDFILEPGSTLVKAGGAGTTAFNGVFVNNGSIQIQQGAIQVNGNLSLTTGTTVINGLLQAPGGVTVSSALAGSGTVNGPVSIAAGGSVQPGNSPGTLSIVGNYNQAGTYVAELNGTAAGLFDKLDVFGTVTLSGPLNAVVVYFAQNGDSFKVLENDGSDAIVGTFAGLPEGAILIAGTHKLAVSYIGGDGNDVVLTRVGTLGQVVSGLVVNGNPSENTQRSRLTTIIVDLTSPMDANLFHAAGAVYLTRTGAATNNIEPVGTRVDTINGLMISPAVGSGLTSSLTLSFQNIDNAGIDFGSLSDGRWQLSMPGISYMSPNSPIDTQLRRLFGDSDNNGTVDASDFSYFPAFGAGGGLFDFNNNFDIDSATDFANFGNRFGYTLV